MSQSHALQILSPSPMLLPYNKRPEWHCNDIQRRSAQLGILGDSLESRPKAQLKSTAGSTDDENEPEA